MRGRRFSFHDDFDIEDEEGWLDAHDADEIACEPDALDRISLEQFLDGRKRRFGVSNPELMHVEFWRAMVKCGENAWHARSKFSRFDKTDGGGVEKGSDDHEEDGEDGEMPKRENGSEEESPKEQEHSERTENEEDRGEKLAQEDDDASASIAVSSSKATTNVSTKDESAVPEQAENSVESVGAEEDASSVTEGFNPFRSYGEPVWCDDRSGETETRLPDGTLVQIAGEHEDSYDPDFMVYNDVIVYHAPPEGKAKRGFGTFDIYGYPEEVFPPTDFHTATFVHSLDAIVIISNLSAPNLKELVRKNITPVYLLKVGTWAIEKKETTGHAPGIIWRHIATIMDNKLRVSGDRVERESDETRRQGFKDGEMVSEVVEFNQVYTLDVETWVWTYEVE